MSLEQVILDRLEKRNAQIAQLQSTIQALERAADTQREHAMLERGLLVDENKNLAARIESAQLEREQMQHQITELRSEHDRILEISKSSVPKSALKQAVLDAAGLSSEVARLRAEIPLESTREALKNAVAKLQEVTTDRDRVLNELGAILAEANKSGRCGGDPVALLKQGQLDRDTVESLVGQAAGLRAEMESLANQLMDAKEEASGVRGHANSWGCKEGETVTAFMQRQAMELAEAKTELSETKAEEQRLRVTLDESCRARIGLGFERDNLKAKLEPPEVQAGTIGYLAKAEHDAAVTAARENGIHKGESLSGFIWRQCESLRKSQAENAPLSKVFTAICKQRGNLNEEIIYRAVDEASDAIKKLTA